MSHLTQSEMPKGKPFPENELVWLDCPKCEYHVRVHQSTQEANMRQHKEKGCPLVTTGEIPEVEDRSPLELQTPNLCGNSHGGHGYGAWCEACEKIQAQESPYCDKKLHKQCECESSCWRWKPQEPVSREESPKAESNPSIPWKPLRKALSDEEAEARYGKYLALVTKVERHPNSARFHEILTELGILHDKKQADYGRGDDPFANVRSSEEWGISSWVGAMVRLNDKVRRLQSLAAKGDLMNEAAEDSFRDIAVYSIIALVLYEQGLADEGQYR